MPNLSKILCTNLRWSQREIFINTLHLNRSRTFYSRNGGTAKWIPPVHPGRITANRSPWVFQCRYVNMHLYAFTCQELSGTIWMTSFEGGGGGGQLSFLSSTSSSLHPEFKGRLWDAFRISQMRLLWLEGSKSKTNIRSAVGHSQLIFRHYCQGRHI